MYCNPTMTMLIAEDASSTMKGTDKERENALAYALPKMLVGGFTSVTLASVAFAGIVSPMVFK